MNILAFGIPGGPEWILIFLVLLLLFGAKKLPEFNHAAWEVCDLDDLMRCTVDARRYMLGRVKADRDEEERAA